MADIEMQRTHDLGLAGARARAETMAADLARKFDLKGDWAGNVLRFERPGLTGSLSISESDVRLSVALGFLMKAMKSSIERAIAQELDSIFAAKASAAAAPAAAKAKAAGPAAKASPARKPPSPRKRGG